MQKILVANENIKQNLSICNYLSIDKSLDISSITDTASICRAYFEINPNVFILDSSCNKISYTDILDKISDTPNEKQKRNTLITLDKLNDNLKLVNMSKVYQVFPKPLNLSEIYSTINLMKDKQNTKYLSQEEIYSLFLNLNLSLNSKGTHYLVCAVLQWYYNPISIRSLDNIFNFIASQYDVSKMSVRSAVRRTINSIPLSNLDHIKDPFLKKLTNSELLTPKTFLNIITKYFREKKK
ncbi:MAG: hypothetical protein HFJ50_05810 [Clostridia bacterium]|jgi:hypothetical protein|nr:hypothetical protein [Clostridia bacterium]